MTLAEPRLNGAEGRADRILDEVERLAQARGTRAIVIADVARDLAMSTKTLYREFPSKDALVAAIVERWATRLTAAQDADEDQLSPVERVRSTVHRLVWFRSRFCDEFWSDLAADHPVAWTRYVELFDQVQASTAEWMARWVRPEVDPELARALLRSGIEMALRGDKAGTTGLTPEQAIDAVIELWAGGALESRATTAPTGGRHSNSNP